MYAVFLKLQNVSYALICSKIYYITSDYHYNLKTIFFFISTHTVKTLFSIKFAVDNFSGALVSDTQGLWLITVMSVMTEKEFDFRISFSYFTSLFLLFFISHCTRWFVIYYNIYFTWIYPYRYYVEKCQRILLTIIMFFYFTTIVDLFLS